MDNDLVSGAMIDGDLLEQLAADQVGDPREPLGLLFRDLRPSAEGFTGLETTA